MEGTMDGFLILIVSWMCTYVKTFKLYTLNMHNLLHVKYTSVRLSGSNSGCSYNKQNSEGKGRGMAKCWPNGTSRGDR